MSLFTELKRRNVFRMAALYAVAGWLLMQVAEVVMTLAALPAWIGQALLAVLAIGFPIALIFSWFFELTPEGLSLEKDVEAHESITHLSGQRINYLVISLLCAGLVVFAFDKWWLRDAAAPIGYANSVAVLAFDDLSPDGDQGWFSDGLSEEIINSLAQLPELKVTARTSAFYFKGLDLPIPEIAKKLGVAHVVEGSVRRAGDRMRVTAQLINAEDGFHLWSETYDRSTDDVFAVQEDIAANIASALDIYLDKTRREVMFQTGTRNVEAYEAYLRGRQLFYEGHNRLDDLGSLWEPQRWFERALALDPEFAAAHFDHGDAYFHYAMGHIEPLPDADPGLTPDVALDLLLQDYDRAIEFAHNRELRVLYQTERAFISDDWSRLLSLLDQLAAIRETVTNPIFTGWHKSDMAFALLGPAGIESNYRHFKKCLELNPLETFLVEGVTVSAIGLGLYDEAQKFIEQREVSLSQGTGYLRFLLLMQTGYYDEYLKYADTQPPKGIVVLAIAGWKALALVLAGRHDEARALIEELLQEPGVPHSLELGMALNLLGDIEPAKKVFEAYDSRRVYSSEILAWYVYNWGGRLAWDLEWTPNFAARLAEMGVKLEPFEFPPPVQ